MFDFTLETYNVFLASLLKHGYVFQTFAEYLQLPKKKIIILRHDVDKLPENSLQTAQIEHRLGIKGSYYFRIVPQSFNKKIIQEIAALGHEIGYHYETMDTCKGNLDKAYDEFCINLERFRTLFPISTICMHGSPLSKYDNRDIWKKYDYHSLGIKGEPYFDIDFSKVFYLTDTGRRWDGNKVSVRDKTAQSLTAEWPNYHSSVDIIQAVKQNRFPETAMITVHPQRWSNNTIAWTKELLLQNIKNVIKKHFLVKK